MSFHQCEPKVFLLDKDPLQEGFKRAAYLSTGSVDSRPTFQRDAVDDDSTESGMGIEGINSISWKDMQLGRGPTQGVAYGSLVMPQFKGRRKANPEKKLPKLVADVRFLPLATDLEFHDIALRKDFAASGLTQRFYWKYTVQHVPFLKPRCLGCHLFQAC